ncbi:ABC-F family ATP-binding cassette domain-containing protein [Alistipes sp. ZOR0009]|uniref:ABC-F family ATP-binding cassette domain-containing protein n=1 Tax=Alistipes sp. ZOR0009 TaxID=1339253 RepID=UPI000649080C|nr:ABC-F family ATP-binding cassette domain-containing protein [Alistipes sp. ZOR0009]
MISINNVTVSFGGTDLFSGISFMINKRDRIGLVGRNGAGKSTLLKVILGERQPDGGVIAIPSEVTIGYLPQQMKVNDTRSVVEETLTAFEHLKALERELEELTTLIASREDYESDEYAKLCSRLSDANEHYHMLGGGNQEGEAEQALLGLGFKREELERPTSTFSGGWRMRIELAKLLLRRPSVLLLDEPTNHLDIESIQWLEAYLKDYPGALVLISHDRVFLDNVTDRTIEISLGKVYDYKTSYSHYVELRKERREQQLAAYTNQQKQIADTEEFIERFRYKATKSNQVQSRIKQLEKLDIIEVDDEDNSRLNIKFPPAPRSGQVVVETKELGKSFGEKHVFSGANIVVERGEKVALVGRNGEGKSTLAKILMGEHPKTRGEYALGHNVKIGYFAQNEADVMDGNITVYDTLEHVAVGDIRTRLRDILGAFLFRGEEADKKVMVLSGGERSRLAMARLMLEPHNLLILDEPTNHMDMRSKDILKQSLLDYDGTLLVVSHDREFLDGLVSKVYEFRDGVVKEHLGGIQEFLSKRKMERLQELERKATPLQSGKNDGGVSDGKQSYLEKKELDRQIRKAENLVASIEKQVEELEEAVARMDEMFSNPSDHNIDPSDPELFKKYNALKKSIEEKMYEWEIAHEELEGLKG